MKLLVDLGNSRLKWAVENFGNLSLSAAIAWQQDGFQVQLTQAWQTLTGITTVLISTVGTTKISSFIKELARKIWGEIEIIYAHSQAQALGVINGYVQPQKLGVDRWLGLLAVHVHYSDAAWMVDCGTAITADYITAAGQHQGGLITSGLGLMKHALATNTNALELNSQVFKLALATNTNAAIYGGTLTMAVGFIQQLSRFQPNTAIILTGGDAEIIQSHLEQEVILDQNLVLKGLALYSQSS